MGGGFEGAPAPPTWLQDLGLTMGPGSRPHPPAQPRAALLSFVHRDSLEAGAHGPAPPAPSDAGQWVLSLGPRAGLGRSVGCPPRPCGPH